MVPAVQSERLQAAAVMKQGGSNVCPQFSRRVVPHAANR